MPKLDEISRLGFLLLDTLNTPRLTVSLSFIALVLFILVRQKLSEQFTVEQALLILRNLKAKVFDHSIIIAEASKKQKTILSLLGCKVPTNPGI